MTDPYGLTDADVDKWTTHFGVEASQIHHDYAISHALQALSRHAECFVFYGGTALSRTILDGLRLSEDIDLLSVGPRAKAASLLDEALRFSLEQRFGLIEGNPRLVEARKDTQACVYTIGDAGVQLQLISGDTYTPWPRHLSRVSLRYAGMNDVTMMTFTPAGFVGAKTMAWCDSTRNAPRDLYDLWALAEAGHIGSDAAQTFRQFGPTSGYPQKWMFPKPPTPTAWEDALAHLGRLQVGPEQAYDTVVQAWASAIVGVEHSL